MEKPLRIIVAEMLAGDEMTNTVAEVLRSAKDFPYITGEEFVENRLQIYAKFADKLINTILRHQMKDRWEHDD